MRGKFYGQTMKGKRANGVWIATGDKPITTPSGRKLQRVWNTTSGEKAYQDLALDIILSDQDAQAALQGNQSAA